MDTSAGKIHPYTVDGHIVGMLDRDLRTAKLRYTCRKPQVFHEAEERPRLVSVGVATPARIPADVTPLRPRRLRKSHYSWKNAQSKLMVSGSVTDRRSE